MSQEIKKLLTGIKKLLTGKYMIWFALLAVIVLVNIVSGSMSVEFGWYDNETENVKQITDNNGLWLRPLNQEGLTYDESIKYCETHGGNMATKQHLMDAKNKGYEHCTPGWHTVSGKPVTGYVMNSAQHGCGAEGYNAFESTPDSKQPVYCYGPLPEFSKGPNHIKM